LPGKIKEAIETAARAAGAGLAVRIGSVSLKAAAVRRNPLFRRKING